MFTARRTIAAIALLAVASTAGVALAGPPADGKRVTLTLGTPSGEGRPASRLADLFARRVAAISKGLITVKIVYSAGDDGSSPSHVMPNQRRLLELVSSNKLQLATIWTPSLELAGVKTFRGFQVPFMLTTKAAAANATKGPASDLAMRGLGRAGLTGLAAVPQGLARLFRTDRPILTSADIKGATIRTPYGPTSMTALRSLGAIPNDFDNEVFADALENGATKGFEAPFEVVANYGAPSSYTAGNLVLYPTITLLAANAHALSGLTAGQRDLIRQAAAEARTSALAAWDDDRDAREYCGGGRWIVRATPDQVAAMTRLGRRARAVFARDPATAAVIRALEADAWRTPRSTVVCGSKQAPANDPGGPAAKLPPSGTYRLTLTEEAMRKAGAGSDAIRDFGGTKTLTINGSSGVDATNGDSVSRTCRFRLEVSGSFVRLDYAAQSECAGPPLFMRWRSVGRNLAMRWFHADKRLFSGWEALYNAVWKRAA